MQGGRHCSSTIKLWTQSHEFTIVTSFTGEIKLWTGGCPLYQRILGRIIKLWTGDLVIVNTNSIEPDSFTSGIYTPLTSLFTFSSIYVVFLQLMVLQSLQIGAC